jgi:hypothetical protein
MYREEVVKSKMEGDSLTTLIPKLPRFPDWASAGQAFGATF